MTKAHKKCTKTWTKIKIKMDNLKMKANSILVVEKKYYNSI